MRLFLAALLIFTGTQRVLRAAGDTTDHHIRGRFTLNGKPLPGAAVGIRELNLTTFTDAQGEFDLYPVKPGKYELAVSHAKTRSESYPVFVKRNFRFEKALSPEIPHLKSDAMQPPFFTPTSRSYDAGTTVAQAVSVFGLSPQYYTFLPSSSKMGVLFESPVIRSQNPMHNAYVTEGLVVDMPFHSPALYATTNLRYTDGVSVSRGVYSVVERDAQGSALLETFLPAGRGARNSFALYANPAIADGIVHYQAADSFSGSVAVRRTLMEFYFDTKEPVPAAIDYQTKNTYRIDGKRSLELVAIGADDFVPLTASQNFAGKAHAQKLKYRQSMQALLFELELKNRFAEKNYLVLNTRKNVTSLTPRLGIYLAESHYAEAGVDLFYEGRSARLLQGQAIQGIDVGQLSDYGTAAYDSGQAVNLGAYVLYRGRFGKFGAEGSARADKYREYDNTLASGSVQLYYQWNPQWKSYAGASLMHRRPEAFQAISLLTTAVPAPQTSHKAETGIAFTPWKVLKLSANLFYTRWSNLLVLRNDTVSSFDLSNSNIYRSAGNSETGGIEWGAVLQLGNCYLRAAYTYQHMPAGDALSYYYRRHIVNTAFIYLRGIAAHTVQMKVWSLPEDITTAKSDALNPAVQLDYRITLQAASGFFFTAEIGQVLNLPWKYLADPHRTEYNDTAALANSVLATPNRATASEELPITINIAAGIKL